jgi:hypothetical protein
LSRESVSIDSENGLLKLSSNLRPKGFDCDYESLTIIFKMIFSFSSSSITQIIQLRESLSFVILLNWIQTGLSEASTLIWKHHSFMNTFRPVSCLRNTSQSKATTHLILPSGNSLFICSRKQHKLLSTNCIRETSRKPSKTN